MFATVVGGVEAGQGAIDRYVIDRYFRYPS